MTARAPVRGASRPRRQRRPDQPGLERLLARRAVSAAAARASAVAAAVFPRPARPLADRLGDRSASSSSGWSSPASIRFRRASAASSRRFGRYSSTLGPGVSLTLALADRPGEEDRRREYPDDRPRLGQRRRSDADRRPESASTSLIRCAGTSARRSSICSRWRSPTRPSARSPKARCARSSARSRSTTRWATAAPRSRRKPPQNMQRILDSYRSGIQVQGIAIKQADPPDAVNDAFKQVTAAQQQAQILHQQRQCLFASAAPEGAGRSDGVRQGL